MNKASFLSTASFNSRQHGAEGFSSWVGALDLSRKWCIQEDWRKRRGTASWVVLTEYRRIRTRLEQPSIKETSSGERILGTVPRLESEGPISTLIPWHSSLNSIVHLLKIWYECSCGTSNSTSVAWMQKWCVGRKCTVAITSPWITKCITLHCIKLHFILPWNCDYKMHDHYIAFAFHILPWNHKNLKHCFSSESAESLRTRTIRHISCVLYETNFRIT